METRITELISIRLNTSVVHGLLCTIATCEAITLFQLSIIAKLTIEDSELRVETSLRECQNFSE